MINLKVKLNDFVKYYKDLGVLDFYKDYITDSIISAKSGIKIKKANRGKFTEYCKGKVTDECIRKAKASGNPTLIKRATFAKNARSWSKKKS
jgi:hypothetical protein